MHSRTSGTWQLPCSRHSICLIAARAVIGSVFSHPDSFQATATQSWLPIVVQRVECLIMRLCSFFVIAFPLCRKELLLSSSFLSPHTTWGWKFPAEITSHRTRLLFVPVKASSHTRFGRRTDTVIERSRISAMRGDAQIGVAVGCLFALLLICTLVYRCVPRTPWYQRWRKRRQDEADRMERGQSPEPERRQTSPGSEAGETGSGSTQDNGRLPPAPFDTAEYVGPARTVKERMYEADRFQQIPRRPIPPGHSRRNASTQGHGRETAAVSGAPADTDSSIEMENFSQATTLEAQEVYEPSSISQETGRKSDSPGSSTGHSPAYTGSASPSAGSSPRSERRSLRRLRTSDEVTEISSIDQVPSQREHGNVLKPPATDRGILRIPTLKAHPPMKFGEGGWLQETESRQ